MPTVRRYTRQATTAPLPAVRMTAAETEASQGVGIEQARMQQFGALARVGASAADVGIGAFARDEAYKRAEAKRAAEKEKERADQLAVIAGTDELNRWDRDTLYDTEKGLLQKRGRDAMGIATLGREQYEEAANTVLARMTTPEQQLGMTRVIMQKRADVGIRLEEHEHRERNAYAAGELEASTANNIDMAIRVGEGDPQRARPYLEATERNLAAIGPTIGMTSAQIEQQQRTARSQIAEGLIRQQVASERIGNAKILYEQLKDQINGDRRDELTALLEAGTVRQEAQKQTATILAAGGTLEEQRRAAKAIEDPKVQDEVLQRIEHENAVKEHEADVAHKAMLRGIFDQIDKGASYASLPLEVTKQLEPNERSGIQSYAEQRARGIPIKTDRATFYRWMTQARDNPEAFSKANLLADRYRLDDGDFNRLADMQVSIAGGLRSKANKEIESFSSRQEVFDEIVPQYGLDPKAKPDSAEGKALLRLRDLLDRRIDAAQELGTKVTNTDIRKTLHELLAMSATAPAPWWTWGGSVSKRVIDLTVDDIPAKEKQSIEEALRRDGQHVTPELMLDTYVRALALQRGRNP